MYSTEYLLLKCDIRKYFPSVDHEILKALLARKIKDPDVLWLLSVVIDTGPAQEEVVEHFTGDTLFTPLARRRGLPIGNLTSQFFANVYLNGFDHFVKERLGCAGYVRYCDDFVVFSDGKARLHDIRGAIGEYLATLRLTPHPRKWQVAPVEEGLVFLGYRVFPNRRRLRADNPRRFRRRLSAAARAYGAGRVALADVQPSVTAWVAHAGHADTFRLRRAIFDSVRFRRGVSWRRKGAGP